MRMGALGTKMPVSGLLGTVVLTVLYTYVRTDVSGMRQDVLWMVIMEISDVLHMLGILLFREMYIN